MHAAASCILLGALTLTACAPLASIAGKDPRAKALAIAAQGGLEHNTVSTGPFRLLTFSRGLKSAPSLVIYIEGDGHAWRTPRTPSSDPSPRDPVALRLAILDDSPSVLYLARPCQFLTAAELAQCEQRYWTSHRYSTDVILAMNTAIDRMLASTRAVGVKIPIGLVGYSGGGTVAALIAAIRNDVGWLVTVAANLDHDAWTGWHRVTPLRESLNPPDMTARLRSTPQVHLAGERDRLVPPWIANSFRQRLGERAPVIVETVPDFDHQCCWEAVWPRIACQQLERLRGIAFTPCRSRAAPLQGE
ncbi:MAG: hypothetical protein ACT4NU_07755 [Chromatiales bacterium]